MKYLLQNFWKIQLVKILKGEEGKNGLDGLIFLGLSLEHNSALYVKTYRALPLSCVLIPNLLPFIIIN